MRNNSPNLKFLIASVHQRLCPDTGVILITPLVSLFPILCILYKSETDKTQYFGSPD